MIQHAITSIQPSHPNARLDAPASGPMEDTLRTMYTDACERVTQHMVRAYGMAFTGWMTGHPVLEFGEGTRPEQHARISAHYRKALAAGIEEDVDRQISERFRASLGSVPRPDATQARVPPRQAIKAQAHSRAQVAFLRGQYQVNMLLFTLFADLERSRQSAVTAACLRGAAAASRED